MNETDLSLAKSMASYWSSFAMYGDPNKYNTPKVIEWPLFRTETDMSIDFEWPLKAIKGLKKDKCDKWDKVGYDHVDFKSLKKLFGNRN